MKPTSACRKSFRKCDISRPINFEHRIHAIVSPDGEIQGLPVQWEALLGPDIIQHTYAIRKSDLKSRPKPLIDPSCITANDISQIKKIIRGDVIDRSTPLSSLGRSPSTVLSSRFSYSSLYTECPQFLLAPPNCRQTNGLVNGNCAQQQYPQNAPCCSTSIPTRLDDQQFLAALSSVVNPGDPPINVTDMAKIADGSTSSVFFTYNKSERRKVAVKCMDVWKQQRRELLFNEVLVMRDRRHTNLVEVFGSYLVNDRTLWVIMEFMDAGSLTDIVTHKRLEEPSIATISKQCLEALNFLHSRKIIHRDIKSDSILFNSYGIAKISDFGFCGQLSDKVQRRRSLLGTPYWFSPQVASRTPYGTDADIWSFGITVLECVFGEPPYFDFGSRDAMVKIIEMPAPRFPENAKVSDELDSFVSMMLTKEVERRANCTDLLNHSFIDKAQHPSAILPTLMEIQQKRQRIHDNKIF
ncbi:protein kinase domain-containing protein [Ditylenchus destructor]|uniref:non-specific serine/threonine protein kinase n=1 Tax=Ditylenchus destructor TaxID=166010 RepID=A0AAD4NBH1_9BILA|nr:protein kinase domain-containing protein [Ditylenchus destructor]